MNLCICTLRVLTWVELDWEEKKTEDQGRLAGAWTMLSNDDVVGMNESIVCRCHGHCPLCERMSRNPNRYSQNERRCQEIDLRNVFWTEIEKSKEALRPCECARKSCRLIKIRERSKAIAPTKPKQSTFLHLAPLTRLERRQASVIESIVLPCQKTMMHATNGKRQSAERNERYAFNS